MIRSPSGWITGKRVHPSGVALLLLVLVGQVVFATGCGEAASTGNGSTGDGTSSSDAGGTFNSTTSTDTTTSTASTAGAPSTAMASGSGGSAGESGSTAGTGATGSLTPASSSGGGSLSSGAPSSGGSGGTFSGGVGGSAEQTTTTSVGTTGMACKNGGGDHEFCLTQEEMEMQARYGYGVTPRDPPRTDEEIAEAWDDQGCLPAYWVGSSNCNPGITPGERRGDQCCYTSCEGELCCGGLCGSSTSSTGSTGGS